MASGTPETAREAFRMLTVNLRQPKTWCLWRGSRTCYIGVAPYGRFAAAVRAGSFRVTVRGRFLNSAAPRGPCPPPAPPRA